MKSLIRVALLVCCLLALSSAVGWAVASASKEFTLPVYAGYPFRARISGNYVAVLQTVDDKACSSTPLGIIVHNVVTGEAYTAFSGKAGWPAIDGNLVAWAGPTDTIKAARNLKDKQLVCYTGGSLVLMDMRNGQYYVPPLKTGPALTPVVWGDYVAYQGKGQNVYCIDMNTGIQTQVTKSSSRHDQPGIGPDLIVWSEYVNKRQVRAYRISTGEEIAITNDAGAEHCSPVTDGKTVVWWGNTEGVSVYDMATRVRKNISRTGFYPDVDSGIVVYLKDIGKDSAVFGYDLARGQEFRISTGFADSGPSIDSNRVVWGLGNKIYCALLKR